MKFYDCQTAPSPRRVRMFIAEKNLEIPTIEVDLRERAQLDSAFLEVNPFATVPVLELDDGTRFLTTAGCRAYLESAYPEPALFGRNASERGAIADALSRIEMDGISPIGDCLRNTAKGLKDRAVTGPVNYAQIPELGERGRLRATAFYAVLDEMIGSAAYVVGETVSVADIDAFIFVEFARWIKLSIPDRCNNLQRWHESMASRPSAQL